MTSGSKTLRVALAVDLPESDCLLIERLEPRVELARDHSLYRPARWNADWEGDPTFERTPAQQAAYAEFLAGADALFGIPDVQPALLAEAVRANPGLRWVHTTAAAAAARSRPPASRLRSWSASRSPPARGCTAPRSPSSPCSASSPAPRTCAGWRPTRPRRSGRSAGRCDTWTR
ncbi:hypothetical protein [Tsukamurella sp. PLM1]|uniref:hypothetical protein n=1 Tax=Tsukamurella sp. PLM1 TaxID=2929795 RepID=UPI0020BF3A71|nr:hypothetical protein [Tsukamurella sp. PLM1]